MCNLVLVVDDALFAILAGTADVNLQAVTTGSALLAEDCAQLGVDLRRTSV